MPFSFTSTAARCMADIAARYSEVARLMRRTPAAASSAWLHALIERQEAGDTPADWVADLCLLKVQATRTMQWCADQAVQILGGLGYMRGMKSERVYREVKVMMIGGGAEEIMKELAARQLGV